MYGLPFQFDIHYINAKTLDLLYVCNAVLPPNPTLESLLDFVELNAPVQSLALEGLCFPHYASWSYYDLDEHSLPLLLSRGYNLLFAYCDHPPVPAPAFVEAPSSVPAPSPSTQEEEKEKEESNQPIIAVENTSSESENSENSEKKKTRRKRSRANQKKRRKQRRKKEIGHQKALERDPNRTVLSSVEPSSDQYIFNSDAIRPFNLNFGGKEDELEKPLDNCKKLLKLTTKGRNGLFEVVGDKYDEKSGIRHICVEFVRASSCSILYGTDGEETYVDPPDVLYARIIEANVDFPDGKNCVRIEQFNSINVGQRFRVGFQLCAEPLSKIKIILVFQFPQLKTEKGIRYTDRFTVIL